MTASNLTASLFAGISLLLASSLAKVVDAANIYVDNLNGSDAADGLADIEQTLLTGPVRTLKRALKLARRGDAIILRKTSTPYQDSLFLSGANHSGTANSPFVIYGNGAILTGLATVPSDGWQRQPDGLWRLSLTRKGYYRFFRNGEVFPEHQFPDSRWTASDLPVDHWATRAGAVYFQLDPKLTPFSEEWTFAAAEMGISLVDVRDVRIVDLELVGFRTDGINADNACRNVVLENVFSHDHGRAGLAVGGSADVLARNSRFQNNGRHSVLVTERGGIELEGCDLGGVDPTIRP